MTYDADKVPDTAEPRKVPLTVLVTETERAAIQTAAGIAGATRSRWMATVCAAAAADVIRHFKAA